jgi:CheY-like chemotaxis protein
MGVRILIVDDSRDTCESLVILTKLWGHEPRVAHEATEALEAFLDFRPQVVLLDIGLPGTNGWEVGARIRDMDNEGHAILVAVSGHAREEDRERSLRSGFDAHLVKPCSPQKLKELLAKVDNATADGDPSRREILGSSYPPLAGPRREA